MAGNLRACFIRDVDTVSYWLVLSYNNTGVETRTPVNCFPHAGPCSKKYTVVSARDPFLTIANTRGELY
jgi:hypothetical protein